MKYENVKKGIFIERPNRFIAHVDIDGQEQICHVKNTGRCRELLVPGASVYCQECSGPKRKTRYDLIAVNKGSMLINMDSQAPNKVAEEYLPRLLQNISCLKPETVFNSSRFDFYVKTALEEWFIEVKGVTLEESGTAKFPDAPTQRGIKHLNELARCVGEGYRAMLLFIVQMKGATHVEPNIATHPEFAAALKNARDAGVRIEAADCIITPDSITADLPLPVRIL